MTDEFKILDELLSYTKELSKQPPQPQPGPLRVKKNPGPKGVKKKPWSQEETQLLEHYLQLYYTTLKGQPPWAYIRNRHGKNGDIDQSLGKRSHVDLQDKARIISGKLWREGKEIPEWLLAAKPPKRILDKMRPTRGDWPQKPTEGIPGLLLQSSALAPGSTPLVAPVPQTPIPPLAYDTNSKEAPLPESLNQ
ncbi:hypothetical protein E3P99_03304 [Wallemia hederae]|uniref:Myb-like domain-containing protein n=1 Tax=Wallemia hederae TaxID=1540922 RepID=A0A4V4LSR2_9BASI|nr:hypothetical protein E3P99_03304 [Wallemia hederae]